MNNHTRRPAANVSIPWTGIFDNSSSHSGDGKDSKESDGDLESDDERNGAGNGSHVDADAGDDENAEHAGQKSSEDSDEMGPDGDDTTRDSQSA